MSRTHRSRLRLLFRTLLRHLVLLFSVLCLLPAVSCVPTPIYRGWTVSDLRLLDPADDTPTPSTDILAVYTRSIGSDIEIRVDLLDLPLDPDYRLQVFLDTTPGGPLWDLSINIPASGNPTVTPSSSSLIPRLIRDPWQDTITIRLNRWFLPPAFTLQVESFILGATSPADETAPVRSDVIPASHRASLLLAFWNTYPATTPAQALRRWDGAHTGPRGERHGLKHIIDNAGLYGIPVALLDLKTPASLAALDFMGITPQIRNLATHSLLILPDVAYAEPAEVSLGFSRRAAAGFGLPASQFVFNASIKFQVDYLVQFYPLDDTSHLSRSGGTRLIPLPSTDAIQATTVGPSIEVRRALMDVALSPDLSDLVILGGDLPLSTWGNENVAAPTFAWIVAHPWIHPLTGDDLLTFPVETSITLPQAAASTSPLLEALQVAPENQITDSAWQAYFMLTAPTADEQLQTLHQNYPGQVSELLAAARWAEQPSAQANCDHDLNSDSQPECILASRNFHAILDPAGARLTNLFYLDATGPHQLVGPSSQFTVGLSDPSEWHPELGLAADPSVIPGAFSDDTETWTVYIPSITTDRITFSSPDGNCIETYRLLEDGIMINYQVSVPVSTRIPLSVDPQVFYSGPTSYTGSLIPGTWNWRLVNGIQIEVRTDAVLSVQSFIDSLPYLAQSENPDRLYPTSHYLPFPLSIVDLDASGNFSVQIIVK